MLLSSLDFFVFLGVVISLFFLVPVKYRSFVLLVASILFLLSFSLAFLIYAIAFVLINYYAALGIQSQDKFLRKFSFYGGLLFSIGGLVIFKYLEFIVKTVYSLFDLSFPENHLFSDLILPIGISYYTFQGISYLYMVYKAGDAPESNIVNFAIFMLFFPKLLAGPIERPRRFLPQMHTPLAPRYGQITDGGRMFMWGLFKKVVVGDTLGLAVYRVYENVDHYQGIPLWIVFIIQPLQLYADFSGYTDMAIGGAKIFGIELSPNFRRPFFARNIGEFWRRWHISLSSWCNDFIFNRVLLKFRKRKTLGPLLAVFSTFIVIGIWHGAEWTFVILGLLQGIAVSYEFLTKRWRKKQEKKFPVPIVNLFSSLAVYFFFSVSLVFFFSPNVNEAFYFFDSMGRGITLEYSTFGFEVISRAEFLTGLFFGILVLAYDFLREYGFIPDAPLIDKVPFIVRWLGYYLLIVLYFYFIKNQTPFVYVQF